MITTRNYGGDAFTIAANNNIPIAPSKIIYNNFMTGFKIFVNFSITLVLLAIFIIPLHKQIVPKRLIDKFIASLVLSKIDEFNFSKFPEKIAKENDIIIKIGQTIFNILITTYVNL